jgi:hypothetical protein
MNQEPSFSPVVEDKNIIFDQYRILIDSINKLNDTRESSNNFWMGVNGVAASLLAYLRDSQSVQHSHKSFLFITLISVGILFSLSWLNYLWTITKLIEVRTKVLINLEKKLDFPLFTTIFGYSEKEEIDKPAQAALTFKEMAVPCLFLAGYLFFAVLLYISPLEVAPPS